MSEIVETEALQGRPQCECPNCGRTHWKMPFKKQPICFSPGDIIEWSDGWTEPHRWRIRGVHLGALDTEDIIEIENVSHKPGWTGEWETHVMMFVPLVLLKNCKIVR
jgi:hypothetical protein